MLVFAFLLRPGLSCLLLSLRSACPCLLALLMEAGRCIHPWLPWFCVPHPALSDQMRLRPTIVQWHNVHTSSTFANAHADHSLRRRNKPIMASIMVCFRHISSCTASTSAGDQQQWHLQVWHASLDLHHYHLPCRSCICTSKCLRICLRGFVNVQIAPVSHLSFLSVFVLQRG